jgi:2-oxoglutarate dehydrogenase E2 component (dihydrolipoamide succinyltransferase)
VATAGEGAATTRTASAAAAGVVAVGAPASARVTSIVEVDVSGIDGLLADRGPAFEQREGVPLTHVPFLARATLDALAERPELNASVDPSARAVIRHQSSHLGIAVDTNRGLVVPRIRDAGSLSVAGLARRIRETETRAQNNGLSAEDLTGVSFTLANSGSRGVLFDTPSTDLIPGAVLGAGSVVRRPWVMRDASGQEVLAIRSIIVLVLTYDPRLVEGADAARFLTHMKSRLERPMRAWGI